VAQTFLSARLKVPKNGRQECLPHLARRMRTAGFRGCDRLGEAVHSYRSQRKVGRAFLPDPVALESQPGMADLPRLPEQLQKLNSGHGQLLRNQGGSHEGHRQESEPFARIILTGSFERMPACRRRGGDRRTGLGADAKRFDFRPNSGWRCEFGRSRICHHQRHNGAGIQIRIPVCIRPITERHG